MRNSSQVYIFLVLLLPDHSLLFLFPHDFSSGIYACKDLCATMYKKRSENILISRTPMVYLWKMIL